MASNNYSQASSLSLLEKAASSISSATNSFGDKKNLQDESGISSSDESSNNSFSPKDKTSSVRHKTIKSKHKKKRKTPGVSSSFAKTKGELRMNHKKQKLQDDESLQEDGEHDLTTPEGQLGMNPKLTEKEAATESKREYNRRNAARSRKRNKFMVGELNEKVHSLTKRTEDLQRSNDVLQAQIDVLQTQNRDLLVSCKDSELKPQVQSSSSDDAMSQLLEQLQGKGEAQQKQHQPKQQGQDITQLLNSLSGQGSSSQLLGSVQGGQQAGANLLLGMQCSGNSQLLSALMGQAQAEQLLPCQQQNSSLRPGMQGQSMSQLLSIFGFEGQPQQQQEQQQQQRSQPQQQQQQQQQQHQQQVSGVTQDQQHLQQLLACMPPEALYNMLCESTRTANNDSNVER
jgi:hypothetical protein